VRLGRRPADPPERQVLELHPPHPTPPSAEALSEVRCRQLIRGLLAECRRRGLDRDESDDITATLVRRIRGLLGYDLAGVDWTRLDRLVCTSVHNELRTRWKQDVRLERLPDDDILPAPSSEHTDPMSFVLVAEIEEKSKEEIARWSPARRAPYLMVRSGMKYEETAAALGKSVNTVSRHMTDAHNALRIALRDYDPPGSARKSNSTRRD
jgi:DNA-directed RNA polymerase specialized sigma24 family protein